MTKQQQTMLREYFEKSQEPVFVILGTLILFVNQSAKALFDTNDLYELECTSKSFRVFEESHDFDGSTDSHQYMSLLDFIHAPTGLKEMLVSPSSS
jgi:DNA polymerase III delta subunit